MSVIPGHERRKGTERTEQDWLNQLVQVADCTGDTEQHHCAWHKTVNVWEHISAALPTHKFPRGKDK